MPARIPGSIAVRSCQAYIFRPPTLQRPLRVRLFHTTPLRLRDPHGQSSRSRNPQSGLSTPISEPSSDTPTVLHDPTSRNDKKAPYIFCTGYAAWPKRPPRPFPPPFFSPPSGSFSDPLSTHNRSHDRVNGVPILGVTNGDDALFAGERFLCVNDGVGAWGLKDRGCAGLWSRLVGHFWAGEVKGLRGGEEGGGEGKGAEGDGGGVVDALSRAFEKTKEALSEPNAWLGTTTVSSALLDGAAGNEGKAVLWVTQLGDCKVMVVRPSKSIEENIIFRTEEQYHYFDCPRQLGTNSPDTPEINAVLDKVEVEEGDIVLAMSDGVTDNLWEHEIARILLEAREKWSTEHAGEAVAGSMKFAAREIVLEARKIAEDVFAESPYMEKGVEEGLAIEGGKRDDISVVAGIVERRKEGAG
nr:hypothetical protein B0A51_09990 [Rachicladosporium sp. CCFEE 5018]